MLLLDANAPPPPPPPHSTPQLTSRFELSNNPLSSSLPTQLGRLEKLVASFKVSQTDVTGSVPKQLGQLTAITYDFDLSSNHLCSDVPDEVQALSSGVESWYMTTGNSIGTLCGWNASMSDERFPVMGTTTVKIDYNGQGLTGTLPTQVRNLRMYASVIAQH